MSILRSRSARRSWYRHNQLSLSSIESFAFPSLLFALPENPSLQRRRFGFEFGQYLIRLFFQLCFFFCYSLNSVCSGFPRSFRAISASSWSKCLRRCGGAPACANRLVGWCTDRFGRNVCILTCCRQSLFRTPDLPLFFAIFPDHQISFPTSNT